MSEKVVLNFGSQLKAWKHFCSKSYYSGPTEGKEEGGLKVERKEKKAKVDENGTRLKKKNEKIFFGNKNKLSKNIRGCKIQNTK